jgi:hypothetical protein
MSIFQSIRGLGRSRRTLVLTPLIIVFNALLIWTLAHTDIVAFATIFVAALVLISGTFWATGPTISKRDLSTDHSLSAPGRVLSIPDR